MWMDCGNADQTLARRQPTFGLIDRRSSYHDLSDQVFTTVVSHDTSAGNDTLPPLMSVYIVVFDMSVCR